MADLLPMSYLLVKRRDWFFARKICLVLVSSTMVIPYLWVLIQEQKLHRHHLLLVRLHKVAGLWVCYQIIRQLIMSISLVLLGLLIVQIYLTKFLLSLSKGLLSLV